MKLYMIGMMLLLPLVAFAEDSPQDNRFNLNIRRIGFDWNKTTVTSQDEAAYRESPVSAFTATSQDMLKGVLDAALEYGFKKFKWDNSLFMEYGKTTLRPYGKEVTKDESADKILFSSDLAYACWELDGLKFGPIFRGQYQTEFVGNPNRNNVIRPNAGFALFDHDILKSLYVVGVYEYDFTNVDDPTSKLAAELGWRAEYDIRDGVRFSTDGYYREYFSYSQYVYTDFERDLNLTVRLDTNVWKSFSLGPYFQYRLAKARGADKYASNTSIGIGFSYIHNFDLRSDDAD
ncbi:MAG: hypothetical protein KBS86_00330 [Proteobacteria bacterium]|nr:hypothetical protein [Candidatus Enterousia scatequi]